ncbi:hypothetical protein CEXT_322021 [Caerostris extrusa]|uniref:Uncharacterized protein n=1 Tax=Caerostris extrusa TaxID=172846 RepID=A0AAV4NLT8_CAEEX|nr:hypothetical protein CEXT_322021 [Caerostris extrusa]
MDSRTGFGDRGERARLRMIEESRRSSRTSPTRSIVPFKQPNIFHVSLTKMHILEVNTLNHFQDSIQYPSDISMPPQFLTCPPQFLSKQNNVNPYSAFIPTSYGVIDSVCVAQCLIFPQQGGSFEGISQFLSRIMSSRRNRGKFTKIAPKWDEYWMELGYISQIVNSEWLSLMGNGGLETCDL